MATVLIVDDDKFARTALETTFSTSVSFAPFDLTVVTASDGQEGIESFRTHRPQVVVTDIQMPRRDGLYLCQAIRKECNGQDVRLVVISGVHRDTETAQQVRDTYQADFFAKPYELREMTQHVAMLLQEITKAPNRVPKQKPTKAVERQGNLAIRPLPAVLLDFLDGKATGNLTLRRDGITKTIELLSGNPVSVSSSVREETLGQLLVASGRITETQHDQAVQFASRNSLRVGEALIQLQILTPEFLVHALTVQTRYKITQCLRWERGSWKFEPEQKRLAGPRGNPIELVETLMDGLKDSASFDPIPPHIARIGDATLKLNGRGQSLLEVLQKSNPLPFANIWTQKGASLRDVLKTGALAAEVYGTLDILLLCGGVSLPWIKSSTATFDDDKEITISALAQHSKSRQSPGADRLILKERQRPEPSGKQQKETDAARKMLLEEYLRIQDLDLYSVLGIKPDAPGAAISSALTERRYKFSLQWFSRFDLGPDYPKLEEIHAAYSRAFETLLDDDKREKYNQQLLGKKRQPTAVGLNTEILFRKGTLLLEQRDFDNAVEQLTLAVRAAPKQADYLSTLGWALYLRGDRSISAADEARKYLNRALAINPEHSLAHEYTGLISADLGNDAYEATLHLERALTANPSRLQPLETLEQLWRRLGQHRLLARKYRQLIYHAANRHSELERELWLKLALLYRTELNDLRKARVAFESASRLAPADTRIHAALADLDTGSEGRFFETSETLRKRWAEDFAVPDPGLELVTAAQTAGYFDAAFVCAGVLVANSVADERAKALYQRHQPKFVIRAHKQFDEKLWSKLRYPSDQPIIGRLFALMTPAIIQAFPINAKDLGIDDDMGVADSDLPATVIRTRAYIAHMLGVAVPKLYVVPDFGAQIHVGALEQPVLLAGEDLLTDPERFELCFRMTQAMTYLLPGRAVGGSRSGSFLRHAMEAALGLSVSTNNEHQGPTGKILDALTQLPEDHRNQIVQIVNHLAQSGSVNLSQWALALAQTAARAGLLLCGDVPAALRFVSEHQNDASTNKLLQFAISSQHLMLRAQLGLSIDV